MFKFVPDNEEVTSDYQASGFSFTPDEVQPDFSKVKEDSLRSDDGSNIRSKDNMDLVIEWAKNAINPKTYVGAGLAIGKQLKPAIEFAKSQEIESPEEALEIVNEVVPEFAKGAAREITVNTPKIASNILRMVGTNIKAYEGDSFVSQGINGLADTFANISDYMGDIEMLKQDPEVMEGKFSDNPSWKRFANVLGGGTGQGLTMAALSGVGGAKLAYGFYALAGGAEIFKESYEKDKDVGKANTLATISAASTYLIDRWLDPLPDNIAKGAKLTAVQVGKEVAKAAYKEPSAEALQQVLSENLVRKIGIDATQDLYEGMIESAIGALGGAASMGAVSATTYAADRAFNQAKERAIENGATEEEISAFERATMAKLEKHPEAFETVFQKNVQQAINEIDAFVKENGDTEQSRKAMQTKADLEEVYTRVFDQIKTSDNDKVAAAQAKVIQGVALWGSQELGISPLEYFEQRFPRIERVPYKEFSRRISEARRAAEKVEINLYEALKNPNLLRGHRKKDTRASLTKFLQSRGGLVDTGGELRGMDANKQVRGLINNKNGNNLDDAALAAWEAGYFPQNSERPSINELLEAIDEELRGNKRFASEAEENLQQQVNDLAEELDRADIDWRNMEPSEIEMAVDAYLERRRSYNESMMGEDTGDNGLAWFQKDVHVVKPYTDRDNPSRLLHRQDDNMLPEEKKAWDDFFASRSDAERIKSNLEKYKGTPWERLAREQVFVHQAINMILDGKTPNFESALDTVSFGKKVTSDINSIANILRGRVLSGGTGLKTVHSVNSSFLNCNPTPGCAKYCYAASALLGRNKNWLKPVLIDTLAENRPDLLAQMIVDEFKVSPLGVAGNKAIRLFDEGDGAPYWMSVIKEINNLGYRVAIFTKRKEFAWEVINNDNKKYGTAYNLVMFSSDASNFNEVEKDSKIPVAFVYSDESEIPMIKKMAENNQVRVILPIKYKGGKGIANEVLQELFNEVPEVRPHVCPIDAGFKSIDPRVYVEGGDVKLADKESRGWNCAFCDRKGGVGCYFGFSTEKMNKMINKAKELKKSAEADIISQFQNLFTLIEALKQGDFVNDRRYREAGLDIEQDQQGNGGLLRDVATSETGRRGDVGWLVRILNKRLSDVSGAVKRVSEAAMPERSGEETGGRYRSSEGDRGYDENLRDDGRGPRRSNTGELSVDEVLYQDRDNTLYRDPKGAYSRRIGQRALISLFERADASTFMHETAHFFFEELKAFAENSKKSRDMLNAVNEWLGYDGVAYTEAQIEQFARGFEQYLREGKAPSNYLKRAFDAFLSWMRNLYKTARELDVQLNDDVRSVYANILGGTELDQYMNASPAEVLGNSKKYWKAKREAMDEIYAKNNASKKAAKLIFNRTGQSIQKVYDGMREYLSDAIVPLEEEIKQISPELYNMNRRLEISKINKTNAYFKRVKGFVEGMSKMSEPDFHTFDLALKNRDTDTVQRLLAKYDLEAGFAEVRNILDDLREQMIDVGVDVAYMPDYYPRKVKDAEGLLDYIELKFGDREEYSIIQKMLDEKRRDGRIRTKEDEAQIVNSLIRGYAGGISLANIGNVKDRTLDVIDQYINRFYKVSTDALVDYISGAVQMIENKKYFGRETKELQNLRRMVANRETTIAEYKGMDPKEAKWKEIKTRNYKIGAVEAQIRNTTDNAVKAELQDRKTKLEAEVEYLKDRRASQVKDIAINRMEVELAQVKKDVEKLADSKIENSVGNLLFELVEQGKIGHSQELRLKELLLARFTNKGLGNEFLRIIRDGGYIWTLGNFESAITQFGDLGTSAYKNGLWNTAFEYAKAWAGKSEITIEDLGLGKVINDGGYADTSAWSQALDKVLKYTGFEKMDRIAKQTQVNSAIRKAREQAKAESPELKEYLQHEFGEKWVDVKEDLKIGAITDEILEYAMFQLLDVQPITIDQMPRYYAEGGKKRLFYMMKSYFIKQLNEYRKICFETAKTDPKKAVIDMIRLTGYLMLFNAGADLLKDLLFGRPIDVTDTLVDNVFIGGSINRYQVMNVKREGLFRTLQEQLLFPVMMDELIVDVLSSKEIKDWNTWKNIPLVGRPYYWWFGGGHLKTEKEEKKLRNQRRNQRRRKED